MRGRGVTWGPEECQVVRRGATREENFGEMRQLRVRGRSMESGVRGCVFVKSLLLGPSAHGRGR